MTNVTARIFLKLEFLDRIFIDIFLFIYLLLKRVVLISLKMDQLYFS